MTKRDERWENFTGKYTNAPVTVVDPHDWPQRAPSEAALLMAAVSSATPSPTAP